MMRYCLRLLTGSGRKLGAFEFDCHSDNAAIARAIRQELNGPVDVWAECDSTAWLLYRSRFVAATAQQTEGVVFSFANDPRWVRKRRRFA